MDYAIEFAKELKKRNNKKNIGAILGKVVNVNPFKISVFDGQILLEQEDLYFCSSILNDYTREFSVENIQGNTDSVYDGGYNASAHKHTLTDLQGSIKLIDTLNIGDEVILLATESGKSFFVIDKVVKL